MAVEFEVESLDKVEETIRGAYVERDGKFVLDADKYSDIKSQGLKAKNKELLGKVKKTQTDSERVVELEKELRHFKLTAPLRDLIGKAGIMPDRADVALLAAQRHFTLDEDGQIQVLDEHGDPIDITAERFFSTVFRDRHPFFYAASQAGGSGARPGGSKGSSAAKSISRAAFDQMDASAQMAFIKGGGTLTDGF